MGMNVHKPRRHSQTGGVDDFRRTALNVAHSGNLAATNSNVPPIGGNLQPINDCAVFDQHIIVSHKGLLLLVRAG